MMVFTKKGNKFSMHFHKEKDETWFVNKGSFIQDGLIQKQQHCLVKHLQKE